MLPAAVLAAYALATTPVVIPRFFWFETAALAFVMAAVYAATVEPLAHALRALPLAHAVAAYAVTLLALVFTEAFGVIDLSTVPLPLPAIALVCALLGALRYTLHERWRRRQGPPIADVFT